MYNSFRRFIRMFFMRTVYLLYYDYCIIDYQSDSRRNGTKSHDVQRIPYRIHVDQGKANGHGNSNQDSGTGFQGSQKNYGYDNGQSQTDPQTIRHTFYRLIYKICLHIIRSEEHTSELQS